MKNILLILNLFVFSSFGFAQNRSGITGKPDTSFSLHNAYQGTLKTHPEIKPVNEFRSASVTEEKNIIYCKTGSRNLLLDAFFPKQSKKERQTAIIIIHGGGWRTGNRTLHYPMAQRLAEMGYTCFTPEYRLSTEALYPAAIHDIKSAIRWVRKNAVKYNLDPDKIVVAGHSAGGQLAAFMGATNDNAEFEGSGCNPAISSKVNAAVDMDGILAFIHPESGEGDDSRRISAATNWFGFSKTENPSLWKQGSALTHVGKNSAPVFFINSAVDRMHAGREDFIAVLDHYNIYSEVRTFENSPHAFPLFDPWFHPTIKLIDDFIKKVFQNKSKLPVIIVAKDGSGNYTTVQEALNAIPANNKSEQVVFIRNGIYREKILLDSSKKFVTLIGEDKHNTVLTYNDHTGKISPAGDTINTRTSWSFKIEAGNFTAKNLTFENDAGFTAGQAVAVESDGDKAVFKNCRFIGNQDVLFTNSDNSRQYFENCYIEGTTDFIFGSSVVWFEQCHIHSKKNSHVTAAATPKEKEFGYVFNNCVLTGDTSLHNVSLGRPWRPYAKVVYMHSYIGPHIKAEGWSKWNENTNHKSAFYAEYKNYGPGADIKKRIEWSKQLNDEEVKKYKLINVMKGWNPLQ